MISKHFIERVSKGPAIFYQLFFFGGGSGGFIGEHMVLWGGGGGVVVERGSAVANRVLRGDYRKLIAN